MKGTELHHRRGKSVADEHQHCPCNLVYLCGWGNHSGCHGWAHSEVFESRPLGFMVLRSVAVPAEVPLWFPQRKAWIELTCEAQALYLPQDQPA